jgi:hypothetical protein
MDDQIRTNLSRNINPEIEVLAKKVLIKREIAEAEHIIDLAFSHELEDNKTSGRLLASMIPTRPKRPLYYVNFEVSHGPRMVTRYVVHYLCAYLNTLLDDLAKDYGGFRKFIPFGGTLQKIKGKITPELYDTLDKYNKIYFVPAKHSFDPYDAEDHLFSLKDAIYCCFITMKLRDEIDSLLKKRTIVEK